MGDPSEVIDLTNSFTLADLPAALVRAVIEINDSLYDSPPPRPNPRRTRSTRRRTTGAQCPIDIVDTPVENLSPLVRSRKTCSKNAPHENKSGHSDEEVVRDRSPLDNGTGTCAICLEKLRSQPLCSTKCGHVFCVSCLQQSLHRERKCPACRKSLREALSKRGQRSSVEDEGLRSVHPPCTDLRGRNVDTNGKSNPSIQSHSASYGAGYARNFFEG